MPSSASDAATPVSDAPTPNMCDGCQRGLPLVDGIHRGESPFDLIGCTADRYRTAPVLDLTVACGNCGGPLLMATCDHFRGTGHEWVLVSICARCRSTWWTKGGCMDCPEGPPMSSDQNAVPDVAVLERCEWGCEAPVALTLNDGTKLCQDCVDNLSLEAE